MLSLDDGSLSKKSDGKYRGFILGIKADFPEDWVFLDRTEANAAFGEDAKNLSPKKLIEKYGQYCDLKALPEPANGEGLTISMTKLDIPADMTRQSLRGTSPAPYISARCFRILPCRKRCRH